MALLHVRTADGRQALVHSSIFDGLKIIEPAPPRPRPEEWLSVWQRLDAQRSAEA